MSKVSRSVYQKLAEENKRLKADLRTITMANKPLSDYEIDTIRKYRKQFQKEDYFNAVMKEVAEECIKNNPEQFKFLKDGNNAET